MYSVKKAGLFNISKLSKVAGILYSCGKDMAKKYELHHWNNSKLKCAVIVLICCVRNNIYLVYDSEGKAVATFQTKENGDNMRFCKLATSPDYSGKGIGSFCLDTIELYAKNRGCKKVCCEVYDKSIHAIEFYKHRNYVECGEEKTLKYTEIKMEKVL